MGNVESLPEEENGREGIDKKPHINNCIIC
jgi:hypothetical protein